MYIAEFFEPSGMSSFPPRSAEPLESAKGWGVGQDEDLVIRRQRVDHHEVAERLSTEENPATPFDKKHCLPLGKIRQCCQTSRLWKPTPRDVQLKKAVADFWDFVTDLAKPTLARDTVG
jgi:hypothetical protein